MKISKVTDYAALKEAHVRIENNVKMCVKTTPICWSEIAKL